jgi:branched-chain amino acid transport system permease protein
MTDVETGESRLPDLLHRAPAAGLTLTFVLLALVPLVLPSYQVGEWTFALSFAIAAAGLNTLISDGGFVSLGHNAFFAFGAYATASLATHGLAYWEVLPLVAIMSLALGWAIGLPVVRLGHLNFALITVGVGFVAPTIAIRLTGVTGGADGKTLPTFSAPGWTGMTSVAWLYYMGLIVLLVCVLIIIGIRRSQAGRALRAQRDNGPAAEAFGVQLIRLRCGIFALSVMTAGVGGWLWGITSGFVAPDSFDSSLSIALLAGVVIGGLGLPATAIFAGIFVEFLPSLSQNISPAFGGLVQGFIIVAVLLIARRGVLGTAKGFLLRLADRGSPDIGGPEPPSDLPGPTPEPEAGTGEGDASPWARRLGRKAQEMAAGQLLSGTGAQQPIDHDRL